MSVTTSDRLPKGRPLTAKLGRDDWLMRSFILVIALYLVLTLAFPLYAMLSKAFSTFQFDLTQIELQVSDEQGNFSGEILSAAALNEELDAIPEDDMATSSDGRLSLVPLFPDFSFRSPVLYKVRGTTPEAVYLIGSERKVGTDWNEVDSNTFRKVVLRPVKSVGLSNFTTYFSTPSLFQSIGNSVFISVVSTIVTVSLAFAFAYALSRSCMRFKGVFRLIAMAPILVPSLLPGIALVYLFGNQGMLKELMMGESIYGPYGIVLGSVFFTFPQGQCMEDLLDRDNTRCALRPDIGGLCCVQSGDNRFWPAQGYWRAIQYAGR